MYTIFVLLAAACAGLSASENIKATTTPLTTEQVHAFNLGYGYGYVHPYNPSAINENFLVVGNPHYNQSQGQVKIFQRGVNGEWGDEPSQILLGPPMRNLCENIHPDDDGATDSGNFCYNAFNPWIPNDEGHTYFGFYGLSFGGDVAVTDNYLAVMTLRADGGGTCSWVDRETVDFLWYSRNTRSVFLYELNQTSNTWIMSQQLFYATDNCEAMLLSMAATNSYIAVSYLLSLDGTPDNDPIIQVPVFVSERLANGTWANTGIAMNMNISSNISASPFRYTNSFLYAYGLQFHESALINPYQNFLSLSEETDSVMLAFNGLYLQNSDDRNPILAYKLLKSEMSGSSLIAPMYATTAPQGTRVGYAIVTSGNLLAYSTAVGGNGTSPAPARKIVVIDLQNNSEIDLKKNSLVPLNLEQSSSYYVMGSSLALSGNQLIVGITYVGSIYLDSDQLCFPSRPPVALIYYLDAPEDGFSLNRSVASNAQAPGYLESGDKVHVLNGTHLFIADLAFHQTAYIYEQTTPHVYNNGTPPFSLHKQMDASSLAEKTSSSYHQVDQLANETAPGLSQTDTAVSERFLATVTAKINMEDGYWVFYTPYTQVFERSLNGSGLIRRQSSYEVSSYITIPKPEDGEAYNKPETSVSIGMTETMLVTSTSAYYDTPDGYRTSYLSFHPGIEFGASSLISMQGSISDISVTDAFIAVAVNTQWSRNVLVYEYSCVLSTYQQKYDLSVESDLDYEVTSVSVNKEYLMVGITTAPYAVNNRDVYTNSAPGKVKFYQFDYVAYTGWNLQHTEETGGDGGPNNQNWNASFTSNFGARVTLGTRYGAVLAYADTPNYDAPYVNTQTSQNNFCGNFGLQAFIYDLYTFELINTIFPGAQWYWEEKVKAVVGAAPMGASIAFSDDDSHLFIGEGWGGPPFEFLPDPTMPYTGQVFVYKPVLNFGWRNSIFFRDQLPDILHPCTKDSGALTPDCGFFGYSLHIANNSLAVLSARGSSIDNAVTGYNVFLYSRLEQVTTAPTPAPVSQAPTRAPSEASNVNSTARGHVLTDGAIAGIVLGSVIFGVLVSALLHLFFRSANKSRSPPSQASGPVVGNSDTTITHQNPLHSGSINRRSSAAVNSSRPSDGTAQDNKDEIPARVRVISEVHPL